MDWSSSTNMIFYWNFYIYKSSKCESTWLHSCRRLVPANGKECFFLVYSDSDHAIDGARFHTSHYGAFFTIHLPPRQRNSLPRITFIAADAVSHRQPLNLTLWTRSSAQSLPDRLKIAPCSIQLATSPVPFVYCNISFWRLSADYVATNRYFRKCQFNDSPIIHK